MAKEVDDEWTPASTRKSPSDKHATPRKVPGIGQSPQAKHSKKSPLSVSKSSQKATPSHTPKSTPKKSPKRRKTSGDAFHVESTESEPEEEFILSKVSRKRRRTSDKPYKDIPPNTDSDEPLVKAKPKRRKDRDRVHAPSPESGSEDDLVSKKTPPKPKATPKPSPKPKSALPSSTVNTPHLKPSDSARKIKLEHNTPEADMLSLPEYDDASMSSEPPAALQAATPDETPMPNEEPEPQRPKASRKRRRQSDQTFKVPAVGHDMDNDDDDDEFSNDRRPKKVPKSRIRTTVPDPADQQSDTISLRKLLANSFESKVKPEPSSSKSNHDGLHGKQRKLSIYTQADAERDARDISEDSDLEEPTAKRLKRNEIRFTNARLERLRAQKLENKIRIQHQMADWLEGEVQLFEKLDMRALDPQLPQDWSLDFNTLPLRIFAFNDEDTTIKAFRHTYTPPTSDFRACKAFRELVSIGSYARDRTILRQRPERTLERGINKYIRWSLIDAQLDYTSYLNRLVIVRDNSADRPNPQLASARLLKKLQKLALEHRKAYIEDNDLRPKRIKVQRSFASSEHASMPPPPSPVATPSQSRAHPQSSHMRKARRTSWWRRLFGWRKSSASEAAPPTPNVPSESSQTNDSSVAPSVADQTEIMQVSDTADVGTEYKLVEPELPKDMGTIYGILISHLVVQVVTYRVADADGVVRSMIVNDFTNNSMDIWNSLAIAITICHARDEITRDAQPLVRSLETHDLDD